MIPNSDMNNSLLDFIKYTPTAFHAVENAAKKLEDLGFVRLKEEDEWSLSAGNGYFVTRNCSSLIAFRIPEGDWNGFMMAASHGDSPCFKIKENPEIKGEFSVRLTTEKYGGMLMNPWMDRPLSIAGRVVLKTGDSIEIKTVDSRVPCAIIPNVPIHMNRKANEGMALNAAIDMLPLFSDGSTDFGEYIAALAGADGDSIISSDLYLYTAEEGYLWNGFVSAPRLDDLQCVFASLSAFADTKQQNSASVFCLFDNEEVGSGTKQGAESTFLHDTLSRVCTSFGRDLKRVLPLSFMASCDNAHAVHPNHPELYDKNNSVYMNGGVVIKHNAGGKYTTDAVSAGIFRMICKKAGVPTQDYFNRADIPGGSTLGNISDTKVSINTVDIGAAQLAMHSAFETAGEKDTEYLYRSLCELYRSAVETSDNGYVIK